MFGFFKEITRINQVIRKKYAVIFYAENAGSFQYFRHLFEALQQAGVEICYITSQKNDPVFELANSRTEIVFSSSTLAYAFSKLKADVVIMTMPDLQQFIFKKSPQVKKYIYVFHALVSTHQQYRKGAFDHFDGVFLAGPHHEKEIRETEKLYQLPAKELVPYGYPLLQELRKRKTEIKVNREQVLLAPSWYEEGIFQTCLQPVLTSMKNSGYQLHIRPHPEFVKRYSKSYHRLKQMEKSDESITMDTRSSLWESLLSSEYLITDRSGIAFEFAFVQRKPAVLIDTPLKIQNKEVGRLNNLPVENAFRDQIGMNLPVSEIDQIPELLNRIKADHQMEASIARAEAEMTYPTEFLKEGVRYILNQLS